MARGAMVLRWDRGGRWSDVRATLERLPHGARVVVSAGELGHPREEGAERSVGLPRGQTADWRFAPGDDCTGLHVHEVAGGWSAHLDAVHPSCGVVRHLQADAPEVLVGAGVGLGVLGGLVVGRGSVVAAIAGGLVGLVVAERR